MKPARSLRKLAFESLEDRKVLAGNVTAVLNGGNLVITGDVSSNAFSVESAGTNIVQVKGFNDGNGNATGINGNGNGRVLFSNFTGNISISTGASRDVVRVTNLIAKGSISIVTGNGNDEIVTGRDTVNGSTRFAGTATGPLYAASLSISTGNQNDTVYQSDTHITGDSTIALGANNDSLIMERPVSVNRNVDYLGNLAVTPGGGFDSVNVTGLVVSKNFTITDGAGNFNGSFQSMDVNGDLFVSTAGFNDSVAYASTAVRGTLTTETFAGSDFISFNGVAKNYVVDAGSGQDTVAVSASSIDNAFFQLGLDDDTLDINNLVAKTMDTYGNSGNDLFFVRLARSSSFTRFNGQDGFDTYRDRGNAQPNSYVNLQMLEIEAFEHV